MENWRLHAVILALGASCAPGTEPSVPDPQLAPTAQLESNRELVQREIRRLFGAAGADAEGTPPNTFTIGSESLHHMQPRSRGEPGLSSESRTGDGWTRWLVREYSELASESRAEAPAAARATRAAPPGHSLFGLETQSLVLSYGGNSERATYSVTTLDGELLAEGLWQEELELCFPELAGFELLGATDLLDF